ncbi:MAG: lactate utilization protein [Desulfobacter sp.]|nr:lactate utilization protein [Desulfobacter sp.]WDP84487.1 MAG: lactate utilization protein [Desulfobacter sp.]
MKMRDLIKLFKENAGQVGTCVYQADCLDQGFEKAVEICLAKPLLVPLMDIPGDLDPGTTKILAAPNLDEPSFHLLETKCRAHPGIVLIKEGLGNYPWGIDMGITLMDFGIASTGTLVLNSNKEETRLSTMLPEVHLAILHTSKIRSTALEMAGELNELVSGSGSYTAFITGASRTADIERVLAVGVHGPLERHIILVED